MIEREAIIGKVIKACESFDFDKIMPLIIEKPNFDPQNQKEFLAEIKDVFNKLRTKGIKEVLPSESFCNLCFFKEEIITFSTSNKEAQFILMFNTDDGYVKDICIDKCLL